MGSKSLRRVAIAAAVVLAPLSAVLFGPASAASAATPACGAILTSSVTFTSNLDCSAYTAGPALTIGANGITIDLNGYSLLGPGGSNSTDGIYADSSEAYANVTVENGTISDFEYDVYINGDRNLGLKKLNLVLDGTNSYVGVYAASIAGGTFSGLSVSNADEAVYLYGTSQVKVDWSNVTNSDYGFYEEYGTQDSYVHDNASNSSSVSGYGFYAEYSSGTVFIHSTADNDYDGFYVYGDEYGTATLKYNQANGNSEYGFYLYYNYNYNAFPAEVVTGNTADHNGYDGIYDDYSVNANVSGNHASYNGEYGINLNYPANYTVKYNVTNSNTYSGLYLYENYSYYNVKTASLNSASYNKDYGLYADYGAPGYSNTALHNAPYDCYNFVCKAGSTAPRR